MKDILLIDDDPILNMIHSKLILRLYPYAIIKSFANGLEGINYLKNENINESIIFLDINMPIMNGWEFLDELDYIDNLPINLFILTSSIAKSDMERAKRYPIVEKFISKPLKVETLNQILSY